MSQDNDDDTAQADPFKALFAAAENAVERIREERIHADHDGEEQPAPMEAEDDSDPAPRPSALVRKPPPAAAAPKSDGAVNAAVTASLIKARNELGELLAHEKKNVAQMTAEKQRTQGKNKRLKEQLESAQSKAQRAREEAVAQTLEKTIKEFLPVLDNLERALEVDLGELPTDVEGQVSGLVSGVENVAALFIACLKKFEVEGYSAIGEVFDPNIHEAIRRVADAAVPANTVVEEYHKGYLIGGKLLRPALVVVSSGPD